MAKKMNKDVNIEQVSKMYEEGKSVAEIKQAFPDVHTTKINNLIKQAIIRQASPLFEQELFATKGKRYLKVKPVNPKTGIGGGISISWSRLQKEGFTEAQGSFVDISITENVITLTPVK